MTCGVCDRIDMIKSSSNPYFVCELDTGYVVIGDHQHFYGYSLFLCKEHVTELHFLPKEIRQKHLEELSLVYEAVYNTFKPEKMNCELLGNGEGGAHMHWHLFPRNSGDTPQRGPVWRLPDEVLFDEAKRPSPIELEKMKDKLKNEIERIIRAG